VIQKIRPEIAHSQSIQMAPACLLAKIFFNVPYIIYCRGFDVYLDWKFKKIISKLVLRDAGAIVTLTEDMKRKVQIICDKNIFVIPNGIEQKRFQNLLRDDIRNKLKIRKNEKIIFFAGTLKLVKGIRYLIEAINIIKQKIPEARLLLVGDGEEDENLKKLVRQLSLENYVIFFGKVSNEEIPKYMVASDIFVLPSLSESFGIVNIEAMASGLPIIATKVGGIPEIIKDGENGFLVEPKNPEQIAERILYLLSNNNIRRSISFNNKEKAKNYSWDLIVNKLIAVYSLCLNKN